MKHYTWDITAQKWMDHFRSLTPTGQQGKWSEGKANIHDIPTQIPPDLNNKQFINWLFDRVANQPERRDTLFSMQMLRNLNLGVQIDGFKISPITREQLFQQFQTIGENKVLCERCRTGELELTTDDYIEYAHLKAKHLGITI